MKKRIRIILSMVLILALLSTNAAVFAANIYTDVPTDAWYNECVDYCQQNKILFGVGDQSFSPYSNMTRGMLVTALYRLDGKHAVPDKTSFTDVEQGSYYYDAVAWAHHHKIVYGFSDQTFAPDSKVSREQVACVIARYATYAHADFLNDEPIELAYSDMDQVSAYARASVDIMRHTGLMLGNKNTEFRPKDPLSRAQAAKILMRLSVKMAGLKPAVLRVMNPDGVAQTEVTLSDADTALLRTIIHSDVWVPSEIPEYIATHEIILDNVAYQFERESTGNGFHGFRFENIYGSKYGAFSTEDTAILEKLDGILFGAE